MFVSSLHNTSVLYLIQYGVFVFFLKVLLTIREEKAIIEYYL